MKKIKLAFVLTRFVVGGVERSFLDLLESLDKNKYDITVFLPDDLGEWTPLLHDMCCVEYLRIEPFKSIFLSQIKKLQLFDALRSLFFRFLSRITYTKNYRKSTEYFVRSMPRSKEVFDCVAAYQIINDECVLGALYRLKAPNKLVWTHLDMNKTESLYQRWYSKFSSIICVSEFSKKSFITNFPSLKNKTTVIHNVVFPDRIEKKSLEKPSICRINDEIIIVTVARLAAVKGQKTIPHTTRLLLDAGYNVRWYLVGDGDMRSEIEKEIEKEQVGENVILLGNKSNPYPYIRACDIYVQTSYVEGWGLTVNEAKILCKPIITTDAGVMTEQITSGYNGIIIPKPDADDLARQIQYLIDTPSLREQFIGRLRHDISVYQDLEALYRLIDN